MQTDVVCGVERALPSCKATASMVLLLEQAAYQHACHGDVAVDVVTLHEKWLCVVCSSACISGLLWVANLFLQPPLTCTSDEPVKTCLTAVAGRDQLPAQSLDCSPRSEAIKFAYDK